MRSSSVLVGYGLALGLLATAGTGGLRADDAVKLLHPETDLVVTVKLKEMLGKPVVQKYALKQIQEMLEKNEEAQKAMKKINMNPMTDLDTLTIGLGMKDPQKPTFVAVIDGKFDQAKLAESAKEDKATATVVNGKTMYEFPPKEGSPTTYGAVLTPTRVIVSTEKTAMQAALGGDATGPSKALVELAGLTDSAAVVSIVATKDLLKRVPMAPPDEASKQMVDAVQSFTIQLKADKDVDFSFAFGTADAASAKKLVDLLEPNLAQAKGMAPLMKGSVPPQFAPLLGMVDTLKIAAADSKAVLSATLKESVLEKISPQK